MHSKLNETVKIATRELRACYTSEGIIAGTHHFTDYWARDGFFAALGSLSIGDQDIVEKMIAIFYRHQRKDGLIPYRIMRGPVTLAKYKGMPSFYPIPRPTYRLRGIANEVLDGTTLTILFTAELGLKGWPRAKKYISKIKSALVYLKFRERDGLLCDGVMAEWNDTALKWGNLLYSNVLYWRMYDSLADWVKEFDPAWYKELNDKKNKIVQTLRRKLWTGKYFADWFDYKRHDYFYPFGNCLAVAWGLTTQKGSKSILKQCNKVRFNFTLETNFPKYPFWRIDPFQQLIGMGDYNNRNLLWWQPAVSYLAALKRMQIQKETDQLTKLITDKVCSDKSIYECYERSGLPVKRLLYSSEKPFAWSAGMVLWALNFR
jgi:glycogen debranching enzyme